MFTAQHGSGGGTYVGNAAGLSDVHKAHATPFSAMRLVLITSETSTPFLATELVSITAVTTTPSRATKLVTSTRARATTVFTVTKLASATIPVSRTPFLATDAGLSNATGNDQRPSPALGCWLVSRTLATQNTFPVQALGFNDVSRASNTFTALGQGQNERQRHPQHLRRRRGGR